MTRPGQHTQLPDAEQIRPRRRGWWTLTVYLLLFVGIYQGSQWWKGRDAPTGIAPELSGVTLDGKLVSLQQLRGQPVLLHFWASWCGICRFEQPAIDAIAEDHAVITVMTRSGDALAAQAYVAEQGIRAPVLVDPDGALADDYGVRGVPATYVIDALGNIDDVEIGYSSETGLRARLWWARR
ncbi:MAG: redoxin domain-containing protein [Granulosicoccaceae bacterium]|jgi:thiol-disulfide isomerase/thioredoxin